MPLLQNLHALRRRDDAHHARVFAAGLLDQVQRLRRRAAGGEHGIEQEGDLAFEPRELVVVDARDGGLLVALQPYVTDAYTRQQLEDRRQQAQARAQHRDRDHLCLQLDRVRLGERRLHLAVAHRQVGGRLVQQHRDHVPRVDAKLLGRGGAVAQAAQAVCDQRMLTDVQRHAGRA